MSAETGHERFLRIGGQRLEKVKASLSSYTKTIQRGPPHYDWTAPEAEQVCSELETMLSELRSAFKIPEPEKVDGPALTKGEKEPELCRATVAWAYDKIRAGRFEEAGGLLKVVLERSKP